MAVESVEERKARWRSVAVSAAAMPSRSPETIKQMDRAKTWEKEHDAYRTARKAGLQPPTIADAPAMVKSLGG